MRQAAAIADAAAMMQAAAWRAAQHSVVGWQNAQILFSVMKEVRYLERRRKFTPQKELET
ncbi:hypothetical protein [Pigmentiphaga soli]|uniref:hypothetical protein n=1 Tax=Pigmentiphaga soli TaxID=1007095 RepID=UPI0031E87151